MKTFTNALVTEAVSYAASHGICISQSPTSPPGTDLSHAPFTLYPSPIPRTCYTHGISITPTLNTICTRISQDSIYLRQTLSETGRADAEFTGRLLQILPDRPVGKVQLSIFRYDYFVHETGDLKMVEMNCIAASFGCLASRMTDLHRFLHTHPSGVELEGELPKNDALEGVVGGIAKAHEEYGRVYGGGGVVVMVGQEGERNAYDQYLLKMTLWKMHSVEMRRYTLAEIWEKGEIREGELWMEGKKVSVVYFRAGYAPGDYRGEDEWKAREMIEGCVCVKCPSVAMQLVGTKKVQQVLDKEGEVEKWGGDEQVRRTFVRQYALDDDVVKMAMDKCDEFVLKPQREGGGNNLYGREIKEELMKMTEGERKAYVLMERIRPKVTQNVLVREGRAGGGSVVSEFGVYGVHVSVDGEEVCNDSVGILLRSKSEDQDDGGVAAGVAVLDSPRLID